MESVIQTQTPAMGAGADEKEELRKIYRRLGYLQIKVLKALAENGGKMMMHYDTGYDVPAIGDLVDSGYTAEQHAWNTKKVCLSLQRRGLATITVEKCPNHKGRDKEFVYLTEKGYKMVEIIKEYENE
ncbi:MAG: hypothetical protein QXU98_04390 [Candidatus Parvarchaeota archaeon]